MVSVLPAIISALAALAGVALGQWIQLRRDATQHTREIQREARQAVRQDRTRFVEERRRVYADCLSRYDQCERTLDHFAQARERGAAPAEERVGDPFPDWVTKELDAEYETLYQELGAHHAYFELIAPDAVTHAAFDAWDTWDVVARDAMLDRGYDVRRLRNARQELLVHMRADLDSPVAPE